MKIDDTPRTARPYAYLEAPAWDRRLARWISTLGSPPFLTTVAILLCAGAATTPSAWAWAGFSTTLTVLAPALYVVWLVRRDKVTDFDLYVREQRLKPFLVTIACTLVAWLALWFGAAPATLLVLIGAGCVQAVLYLAVTLRWKISIHSATAAGLAVVAWRLFGLAAAPIALTVPLVAWSRIRLGRHDLSQTVAGAVTGAAILTLAFYLSGGF